MVVFRDFVWVYTRAYFFLLAIETDIARALQMLFLDFWQCCGREYFPIGFILIWNSEWAYRLNFTNIQRSPFTVVSRPNASFKKTPIWPEETPSKRTGWLVYCFTLLMWKHWFTSNFTIARLEGNIDKHIWKIYLTIQYIYYYIWKSCDNWNENLTGLPWYPILVA